MWLEVCLMYTAFEQQSFTYAYKSQRLSSEPLVPETYALDYPTIEDLLALLDANNHGTGEFLTVELHNEMRLAGMIYVDDLAMVSEKVLYLGGKILPEKIQAIFLCGKEMITTVHEKHESEILDLKAMREQWERCKAGDLYRGAESR